MKEFSLLRIEGSTGNDAPWNQVRLWCSFLFVRNTVAYFSWVYSGGSIFFKSYIIVKVRRERRATRTGRVAENAQNHQWWADCPLWLFPFAVVWVPAGSWDREESLDCPCSPLGWGLRGWAKLSPVPCTISGDEWAGVGMASLTDSGCRGGPSPLLAVEGTR